MMNYIWCGIMLVSVIAGLANGRISETVNAGISAAQNSVTTTLAFAGIMCMWSGIMKIADNAGISDIIGKILSPITRLIFPSLDKKSSSMRKITMNITANLLGMGNAATPLGIEAMKELSVKNRDSEYASDEMCTFVVLNTASFQLIPTTIIALRAAAGSVNPSEIVFAIWVASAVSLTSALVAVKIMLWCSKRKNNILADRGKYYACSNK